MRKSHRIPIAIFGSIAMSLTCLALIHGVSGEETDSAFDRTAFDQLKQRPLKVPTVTVNEPCPVSRGSRDIVPHDGYIFCSGCFWSGKRPVLVAMSWSDQSSYE